MRNLILAASFTLLGITLAGCDGGSNPTDVPDGSTADTLPPAGPEVGIPDAGVKPDAQPTFGLGHSDAGMVYCNIPSPTGDAVDPTTGETARDKAMSSATTGTFRAFTVISNDPTPVCLIASGMTSSTCADAAHDFKDASGILYCWGVGISRTDSTPCSSNNSGTTTCAVWSLSPVPTTMTMPRITALCSLAGVFVGWACN